jgi:hypothetical protein
MHRSCQDICHARESGGHHPGFQSMIRKSGNRFSEKIMLKLKQRDEIMIRFNRIMIEGKRLPWSRSSDVQ